MSESEGAHARWIDEELPRWREVARRVGYAIAVHGSVKRDIDLVAIPWTEEAGSAQDLVDAVTATMGTLGTDYGFGYRVGDPNPMDRRPHGRMSWAITPLRLGTYIDLSVMPRKAGPCTSACSNFMAIDKLGSAEEFWRQHPNPTLQERIDYLEHCYAVDPISRDTRIQLSKQIEDLKTLLREREGEEAKK